MTDKQEKKMYFIVTIVIIWTILSIIGFVFIFESYSLTNVEQRGCYFGGYIVSLAIVIVISSAISKDLY